MDNNLKSTQALAEVFLIALEAVGADVRREVLLRMLGDKDLREDVEAAFLWEERKNESSRDVKAIMGDFPTSAGDPSPSEKSVQKMMQISGAAKVGRFLESEQDKDADKK